jgi:hypothetical protein
MVGDTAAALVILVLVIVGIIEALSKRARRDEILPPSKVREFQQRLQTSHENLRKKAK